MSPDLNRTPTDMDDALRLVSELRDEIRRRPSFIAYEEQQIPRIAGAYFELEIAKTYLVKITDSRGRQLTLAHAVCVGTPEESVTFRRLDLPESSHIVCTDIEPRKFPPDYFSVQLGVAFGGAAIDPRKYTMVMPPISDQGKRLVADELHAIADRITADLME